MITGQFEGGSNVCRVPARISMTQKYQNKHKRMYVNLYPLSYARNERRYVLPTFGNRKQRLDNIFGPYTVPKTKKNDKLSCLRLVDDYSNKIMGHYLCPVDVSNDTARRYQPSVLTTDVPRW